MRSFNLMSFTLASSLAVASASSLLHQQRDVSPDNTCGNTGAGTAGYTCPTGNCCSQYGYCGTSSDYCSSSNGCQSGFGTCTESPDDNDNGSGTVSPDLTCGTTGAGTAGYVCPTGLCCSGYGYCGNSTDYCLASNGCQDLFGDCTDDGGDDAGDSDSGRCGPSFNGAVCASNECCSAEGYCGTTTEHCQAPDCLFNYGPACDANKTPSGTNTTTLTRSKLSSVAYGGAGIYSCVDEGVVAITYDDGPSGYTNDLLDLLAKYNAKATFFITGNNNGKGEIDNSSLAWPTVIKRQHSDGHQIASHTWSHADLSNITSAQRKNEMVKNEMALRNILGFIPTYMRPPYSSCTAESGCQSDLADLGYHIIYFDLDTQDYLHTTPDLIQTSKDIVDDFFEGKDAGTFDALSIAHDIHYQTVYNLTEYMLKEITSQGYRGVTVGECLGDPVENWYIADSSASTASPVVGSSSASAVASSATSAAVTTGVTSAGSTLTSVTRAASSTTALPSTTKPTSPSTTSTASTPTTTAGNPSSGWLGNFWDWWKNLFGGRRP
ncbi:hypothetical protein JX266_008297 [Neoarthrinium moseri]|nr:hypothetical protein JX266_008297 [Neoarthrinium moseri]